MRHLLGIADLHPSEVIALLDRADGLADGASPADLAGRLQINALLENSTRTAVSFAIAAGRAGMGVVTFSPETSSLTKGESLLDTARTLDAMGPDVLVIRHAQAGAARRISEVVSAAVINAGDGTAEHPTQALLDALALRRRFGRLDGLTVAIVGDLRHSRVAGSNMALLPAQGVTVLATGPAALMPDMLPPGVERVRTLDEALGRADAVMALRVQRERLDDSLDVTAADYHREWGLTPERLASAPPSLAVMHPGPFNRGVEIADVVADDPERSLILEQVRLGVPTRIACLEWVLRA